ncbi:MAG: hypothetical protein ACJAWZ_004097, partial [Paracoccaceae bacterium]
MVVNFSGKIDLTDLGAGVYWGTPLRFVRPESGMVVAIYYEGWSYSHATAPAPHGT